MTQRIGFFGGTFDPPHNGHVAIARAAADAFNLSEVWWAPVGHQPLKQNQPTADFDERMLMVRIACMEDDRFVASNLDAPRSDGTSNYTVDTLARLQKLWPEDSLWNIVGADSFLDLRRWKQPEKLLEIAEWIVVSRPGFNLSRIDAMNLTPAQREKVHLLTDVDLPLSATAIREDLHRGVPSLQLPENVMSFIQTHGLYR